MAFTPRLDYAGMQGNPWWYSNDNIFYAAGYGLPNCTCYAYGRVAEANGRWLSDLGVHGNGKEWWNEFNRNVYSYGDSPALGAIACFGYNGSAYDGHVAVVEQIFDDGSINISESGYNSYYFRLTKTYQNQGYMPQWAVDRGYYLQGFIYCGGEAPIPPSPAGRRKGLKVWQMCRKFYI